METLFESIFFIFVSKVSEKILLLISSLLLLLFSLLFSFINFSSFSSSILLLSQFNLGVSGLDGSFPKYDI